MPYLETTPDAEAGYLVEKKTRIAAFAQDEAFRALSNAWRIEALKKKYMNNYSWLGRPIIQLPTDMVAIQEIIWAVKPDLVIETGIAHGGSLILSASILELLGHGKVIGVDIDIRSHNRHAIENHHLAHRIQIIEGSSVDPDIVAKIHSEAKDVAKIVVLLDSNHTHEHVFAELNAYANLVSVNSYCVVFDTFIEDMPDDYIWNERPWGKGNNPKTAVWEWIKHHPEFAVDHSIEDRLLVTSAPNGFLQRISWL
ncbi:cephalosporin hydroxylase family protein [Chromatium okenii]|uniref:cephalosporin hydroxylase family protein n=1 Tax=Chromatium okenii TaxID=61644 RepID=UPI0026EEA43D|nr:cephalosporin hydroxylase family protein [Chromatium okenii]